jgi:hypothetical protein
MNIRRHSRHIVGVAAAALALGACDFISPIEANPNSVPTATVDQLFTGAQVNTFFLSSAGLSRIASIWTQQMNGVNRQHQGFADYVIGEPDFEDEFSALYTQGGLVDIKAAIQKAEDAGRIHYAGILKIHEAYLVGLISSFYGDIPYSEAANPDIATPAVDDQAAVYAAVQALLDEAIADLASGTGGVGPAGIDMAFGGDVARWTAVAYSLKARFHMHWAEVNGTPSYTAARDAALLGVRAAAGDWKARFGTSATEQSMWFQFQRDRGGDIAAGEFLVPLLNTNADPRAAFYFDDAPPVVDVSDLSPTGFGMDSYDFPIVTCAETLFIEAEARFALADEPGAITAANAALDCEEAEYGVTVDLSGEQTTISGLAGAALFDEIMEQKYIAQFLNPDVFNDYKRTCRPAITERPNGMPGRLFYGEQERKTNPNIDPPNTGSNGKYNDNDPTPC